MVKRISREELESVSYTYLEEHFTRKLMYDLQNNKINEDEFRRISRALSEIACYLDYNKIGCLSHD